MNEEEKKVIEELKIIRNSAIGSNFGTYCYKLSEKERKTIQTTLNLIEKQDKMIDLMAEYIDGHTYRDDECGCELEYEKGVYCEENEYCKSCIKEYFRKKVEND